MPTGIDLLLFQINGPKKIPIMTKIGAHWDLFKDHTGLEEELKKKALGKDLFLVKTKISTRWILGISRRKRGNVSAREPLLLQMEGSWFDRCGQLHFFLELKRVESDYWRLNYQTFF